MGTEFKNQVLTELCTLLKVELITSTPHHHQTLGTVERSHRTLNEYLRSYISTDKSDWDEWLKYFTYCYNTTPSTSHGYCPFELVYGKIPNEWEFLQNDTVDPFYNIDAYAKEVKYRLQSASLRAHELLKIQKINQKNIMTKNPCRHLFRWVTWYMWMTQRVINWTTSIRVHLRLSK